MCFSRIFRTLNEIFPFREQQKQAIKSLNCIYNMSYWAQNLRWKFFDNYVYKINIMHIFLQFLFSSRILSIYIATLQNVTLKADLCNFELITKYFKLTYFGIHTCLISDRITLHYPSAWVRTRQRTVNEWIAVCRMKIWYLLLQMTWCHNICVLCVYSMPQCFFCCCETAMLTGNGFNVHANGEMF